MGGVCSQGGCGDVGGVPGPGGWVSALGGVPSPGGYVCSVGGVSAPRGSVSALGGCTWSGGVCSWGGVPGPRRVSGPRAGVCLLLGGGVCSGGCLLPGGCQVLPPVNRMTNRYKNITLPQTSFAGSNKVISSNICY